MTTQFTPGQTITKKCGRTGFSDQPTVDRIVQQFLGGDIITKIAKDVKCDPHRITLTLKAAGVDVLSVSRQRNSQHQRELKKSLWDGRRLKGCPNPRRRVFTDSEKELACREFTSGKTMAEVSEMLGCCPILGTRLFREMGIDTEYWRRKKISSGALASFRRGRVVPIEIGYGTKTPFTTPFQGDVVMRSRLEAKRAEFLDSHGIPWFYELARYTLADGRTYLPDFWVVSGNFSEVRDALGSRPTKGAIESYLQLVPHQIEDVKGWWGPDHKTYQKVELFRSQSKIQFKVVLKKKEGWVCL